MKSVLFINRVYAPDHGATGQLLAELAQVLAQDGWRVTIVAAQMENSVPAAGAPQPPEAATVDIHRVRGLPFTRAAHWKRALSYASLYPAMLWRVLRLPRHDVVVTLTDPPLQLLLGPVMRFFKRCSLVHWAQDLYPELAEELGVLRKGGISAGVLRRLSSWALRHHNVIVSVGRCMSERLVARGALKEKIIVIPNWAVGFKNSPRSQSCTRQSQIFTVLYSGNFGLAHPFEGIIEAVKILEKESAPVRFVFAGSGPRKEFVQQQLAHCRNAEFRESAPLEELQASLSDADVHLACMSDRLLGLVVPSKVYGALAVGRACAFLGPRDSEVARLLLESDRGVVLKPSDGQLLAETLGQWSLGGEEFSRLQARCEMAANERDPGIPLAEFKSVLERLQSGVE